MTTKEINDLINKKGFIKVNKEMAKNIGTAEAILYAELLGKQLHFAKKRTLTKDGYFYATVGDIECEIGIKKSQQATAIEKLISAGLIICQRKGVGAKRHFKILTDKNAIEKAFADNKNKNKKPAKPFDENIFYKQIRKLVVEKFANEPDRIDKLTNGVFNIYMAYREHDSTVEKYSNKSIISAIKQLTTFEHDDLLVIETFKLYAEQYFTDINTQNYTRSINNLLNGEVLEIIRKRKPWVVGVILDKTESLYQ